jgi:hypothetical protein
LEQRILNTKRNKRWNGKIDTLSAGYFKDVIAQMETYGDRVQFGLYGPGQRPNYQVINTAGKKMAFDSNNHLLHAAAEEFVGANATAVFTLEQVKAAMGRAGVKSSGAARSVRAAGASSRRTTTLAKAKEELIDAEKYVYFKNNRQALPPTIGEHSDEISELMKKGLTAEEAFGDVVKRRF